MFGVGIHFSIKDLMSVRAIVMPGAIGWIVVATSLGVLLGSRLSWGAGDLARLPRERDGERGLRGHAVICGFGRVGNLVGEALQRRGLPFVVIEQERRRVERLRKRGIVAINGDASNPGILDLANLSQARVLVVSVPDPPAARLILEHARKANPRLDVVVRTSSMAERDYLYGHGTDEVVISEMETGLEMARHTLRRFGLGSTEAFAIIQALRLERGERVPAAYNTRRGHLTNRLKTKAHEAFDQTTAFAIAFALPAGGGVLIAAVALPVFIFSSLGRRPAVAGSGAYARE